jgi:hypothetical protein
MEYLCEVIQINYVTDVFYMNVFDIQKDHSWKHGNIMNFGFGLG